MRIISLAVAALLGISLWACAPTNTEEFIESQDFKRAKLVRVVDGDTLLVRLSSGEEERVRLIGINAPESVAPDESRNTVEGEEASAYMKSLVGPEDELWLVSDVSDRDQYERLLRYVWLEVPDDPFNQDEVASKMLNGIMVAQGHAEAKNYEPDSRYREIFEAIERKEVLPTAA